MSQATYAPLNPAATALTFPAPAFFRMSDVVRITALSRATVYRRIAEGRFPPPVHLGGRACGWPPNDLQRWIDDPQGYRAAHGDGAAPTAD
jgi:predicted DNA-binding transcriptional regulator AlpA